MDKLSDWIFVGVSTIINAVIVAFGYGKLNEKVENLKIDKEKMHREPCRELIRLEGQINTTLASIKSDLEHIKKTLESERHRVK